MGINLFFVLISLIMYIRAEDNNLKIEQLKKNFEEIKTTKHRSKILSCMALLTNSLKDGNNILFKEAMQGSTDKSKSYDKFLTHLIVHCTDNIKDNDVDKVTQ
jgi:hypothetical protein